MVVGSNPTRGARQERARQNPRVEQYHATPLHELIHWTGHPQRLDREFGKRFGDQAYAFEELVAELGSAFLSADLGLSPELHHAEYVGHWVKLLTDHRQAIFTAAAKASAAAAYLKLKGIGAILDLGREKAAKTARVTAIATHVEAQ